MHQYSAFTPGATHSQPQFCLAERRALELAFSRKSHASPALWVYPQFRPHSDSGQVHSDSDQIPHRILIRMVFCTEIKSPALGMAPECRCAAPPRLCSPRASAQTLRGGQGGAGARASSAWALARPEQSSGGAAQRHSGAIPSAGDLISVQKTIMIRILYGI